MAIVFLRNVMLSWLLLIVGQPLALADNIDDLLRETDRALGRGSSTSNKQEPAATAPNKNSENSQSKAQRAERARRSPLPAQSSQNPAAEETPGQSSSSATPGVLTPIDAESVKELISVGLRREAMLRPDNRSQRLGLSLGTARLHGTHELSKDDDTFRVQRGEQLTGLALTYLTEIGSQPWQLGTFGSARAVASLGVAYLKGRVAVARTGVQNKLIDAEYNLIPVHAGLGMRHSLTKYWRLTAVYGPAVEMLVQRGEGNSDSTSGMFFADGLDMSIEHSLTESLWFGVTWQARGLMKLSGAQAGHNMLAITFNTSLAG